MPSSSWSPPMTVRAPRPWSISSCSTRSGSSRPWSPSRRRTSSLRSGWRPSWTRSARWSIGRRSPGHRSCPSRRPPGPGSTTFGLPWRNCGTWPGGTGPAPPAVDRVFAVKGRGTVVTGTLRGGPLERNAPLRLEPGGSGVRPRELQVRGIAVQRGGPGGRLAANLAGVDRAAVGRGSTLTADPAVVATDRLLVALRPSLRLDATRPTVRAPLAGGTVVRLHLGTAQAAGVIRRGSRDVDGLPGGEFTTILRLEVPVAAASGDRFVLRRPSPAQPLAGGLR